MPSKAEAALAKAPNQKCNLCASFFGTEQENGLPGEDRYLLNATVRFALAA
jgi:hypothetical protein